MGFYMELHCDTPECPHGGNEEGIQGANRASIKRDARAAGWKQIDGAWFCDGCVSDKGLKVAVRRPRSRFARDIAKKTGNPVSALEVACAAQSRLAR